MPKLGLGLPTLIQGDVIAWTPSEISTIFWYDAADTSTLPAGHPYKNSRPLM